MRKKLCLIFFVILIVTTEFTFGKKGSKTKLSAASYKNHSKNQSNGSRSKRSLKIDHAKSSWIKEKKYLMPSSNYDMKYEQSEDNENIKSNKLERQPFWGTRGRRDISPTEYLIDKELPTIASNDDYQIVNCKHCEPSVHQTDDSVYDYLKERRDDLISPFWGNRGRRNSEESGDDNMITSSALSLRDKNDDSDPFWGNRGRRDNEYILQKAREQNEPFWGNRGRRDDGEVFWGSRGRREESEPFWGNRGRRQESEPFWGNRGRRQDSDPFWGNRGRLAIIKENLKESILLAISKVENEIENLTRLRKSNAILVNSYWNSKGRNNQLKYLFNGSKYKLQTPNRAVTYGIKVKPSVSSTVLHDKIYAEQPRYVLVDRSSRSSGEDDPYYISRGKKKFYNVDLVKAARDRRGAIEELVKSVRNDPYYIARGKKDSENKNSSVIHDDLGKAKDLICALIDLLTLKSEDKREVSDSDRDRRTILKKLAAQLQIDPYFVSRGKKNEETGIDENNLEEFINAISLKCR